MNGHLNERARRSIQKASPVLCCLSSIISRVWKCGNRYGALHCIPSGWERHPDEHCDTGRF